MIDKSAREVQALKDARRPFAETLTELGLMEHFFHRTPAEIDRLIEAIVTGYVNSMVRQGDIKERTGTASDDPFPFPPAGAARPKHPSRPTSGKSSRVVNDDLNDDIPF